MGGGEVWLGRLPQPEEEEPAPQVPRPAPFSGRSLPLRPRQLLSRNYYVWLRPTQQDPLPLTLSMTCSSRMCRW